MKLALVKGTTNSSIIIFIQDSSSSTGAGLTGLVFNTASLVCYYVRPGSAAAQLTLATQTVTGAHSDGGFVEVDSTNMPGMYRLDLSDAILATGVDSVGIMLKGAANMAQLPIEIQLTTFDLNSASPDVNVLQISGDATAADNLELDYDGTGYAKTNSTVGTVTTLTGHTAQTGDNFARLGAPAGASVSADIAAVKVDTAATLVDTADMQPKLGTPAGADISADIAAVKVDTAATLVDTAEIGAAGAGLTDLGGMSTAMKAEVNTEAKDVLATDTIAELAQAAPTATPTIETAIMALYMTLRNEVTVTATSKTISNDAGTVIFKKGLSDDGTTYTETEAAAGP